MKVRCIDDGTNRYITTGLVYQVTEYFKDYYILLDNLGNENMYLKKRFEIVEDNMKEYTIQEVLEVIEEGQKYKCTRGSYNIKFIEKAKTGIRFIYANKDREALIIGENARFTLVKQDKEVSFMDAMKALKDKNKVYCILGDKKFDFYLHYNNAILDQEGCITIVQLLEGKWFIKA